ncbi:M48 family metallopeptidase [Phaeocystidibacter marisrubri]|uniref:M48 family metalloprotease n=1 Tax=Phaeocystidibacter marisrubri TaxID=1577780 RepID=A0A6L3ZKN6_9FLAO|nr:M48 family metallopeptidase [Phaeocystidibacter marisrubri]KAB2818108.1 M48 family metalloprotease [Phaeocystidibacter marisrubri]
MTKRYTPAWMLVILCTLFSSTFTFGQTYTESQGDIPDDLTYRHRLRQLERHEDAGWFASKKEDAKVDFDRYNEFFLNELLLSGDVLYGDDMTNYLNDIVDKLIASDRELRESIIVYTIKMDVPNAFMTADGHLFVSTGLLAQVQNETQLAFILAHEIGHFANNDVDREFDYNFEQSVRTTFGSKKSILSEYSYSKKLEESADEFATELLISSGAYNPENAIEIFDILLYSYLPFDEIEFNPHRLLPEGVSLPPTHIANEINEITAVDDYDDSESTHPNIKARREAYIDALLNAEFDKTVTESPLGVERFHAVQDIARKDVLRSDLIERDYSRAIYNAYVMTHRDSVVSPEIEAVIGYAIHAIAAYKVAGEYDEVAPDLEDVEGQSYGVNYFFEEISKLEATALAVSYNYALFKQFSDNSFIEMNYKESLKTLVVYFEKDHDDFIAAMDTTPVKDTLTDEEFEALSKLDKIRYKRELEGMGNQSWVSSVLHQFREDEQLIADFKTIRDASDESKSDYITINMSDIALSSSEIRNILNHEYALGINEAIVLAPSYIRLNEGKDNPLDIQETYYQRKHVSELMKYVFRQTRFQAHFLSPIDFRSNDGQDYRDFAFLRTWASEQLSHGRTVVNHSMQSEADALVERYGTPYVVMPLLLEIKEKDMSAQVLLGSLLYPVVLPFTAPWAIYEAFTPQYNQMFITFVFDLNNNEVMMVDIEEFDGSMSKDYASMIIYDAFFQIQNGK